MIGCGRFFYFVDEESGLCFARFFLLIFFFFLYMCENRVIDCWF